MLTWAGPQGPVPAVPAHSLSAGAARPGSQGSGLLMAQVCSDGGRKWQEEGVPRRGITHSHGDLGRLPRQPACGIRPRGL